MGKRDQSLARYQPASPLGSDQEKTTKTPFQHRCGTPRLRKACFMSRKFYSGKVHSPDMYGIYLYHISRKWPTCRGKHTICGWPCLFHILQFSWGESMLSRFEAAWNLVHRDVAGINPGNWKFPLNRGFKFQCFFLKENMSYRDFEFTPLPCLITGKYYCT